MKFKIFQEINIDQVDLDKVRENGFAGYAHYYLHTCWNKSELKNEANVAVYKQLIEIDSKLGLTQTEQLFKCVFYSVGYNQMDIIKV